MMHNGADRCRKKVTGQFLILLYALLTSRAASAQCALVGEVPSFLSSNRNISVKLLPGDQAEIRRSDNDSVRQIALELDFSQVPRSGYVLNSGEIILLASGCQPKSLKSTGISVYNADGQRIWQKTIDELLPEQPALFDQGPDYSRWFSDRQLLEGSGIDDAVLNIVLVSQDVLKVNLASGNTEFQPVASASLSDQPDKAVARADYQYHIGDVKEALAILEPVHARHPDNYQAAELLSRIYEQEQQDSAAIRVLEALARHFPLVPDENENDDIYSHPSYLRIELSGLYVKNKQYSEAKVLLEPLYAIKPTSLSVVRDYAEVLFNLGDDAKALEVLNRFYEKKYEWFRANSGFLSSFEHAVENISQLLLEHQHPEVAERYRAGLEQLEGDDQDQWYLTKRGDKFREAGDHPRAVSYYQRAAEKSVDGELEFKLAELYREQPQLAEDHLGKAIEWYLKAAMKPHQKSIFGKSPEMALCYLYRVTTTPVHDVQLSFHWCTEAANLGYGEGQFWAAMYFGDQRLQHYSPVRARELLLKAREQNYPGWGMRSDPPPTSFEPQVLLKEHFIWAAGVLAGPAFRDDPVANYTVGEIYSTGYGVEKNSAAAKAWLQKSAHSGYAKGMLSLAEIYLEDRNGRINSEALVYRQQAFHWYAQAASQGEKWGHYYMAKLLMGYYGTYSEPRAPFDLDGLSEIYQDNYDGSRDFPRARRELDRFTQLYREEEDIRKQKRNIKESWGVTFARHNPAEDAYSDLAKLEAEAAQDIQSNTGAK